MEHEIANFGTKTLNFHRVMHLNWLVKIELREARGFRFSILFTNAKRKGCMRKMLKGIETKERQWRI